MTTTVQPVLFQPVSDHRCRALIFLPDADLDREQQLLTQPAFFTPLQQWLKDLKLPDFRAYAVEVPSPGAAAAECNEGEHGPASTLR